MRTAASSACVDFEFSGHSSVAVDAADHIEHISARQAGDALWYDLLADLGVTQANRPAFLAAQRTCALRWLAILWKQRHQRTVEFEIQYNRVQLLHSTHNPWAA